MKYQAVQPSTEESGGILSLAALVLLSLTEGVQIIGESWAYALPISTSANATLPVKLAQCGCEYLLARQRLKRHVAVTLL
jgi:hypothetical protein